MTAPTNSVTSSHAAGSPAPAQRDGGGSEQWVPASDNATLMTWLTEVIASSLDLRTVLQAVTDVATMLCRAKVGAFFYNEVDDRGAGHVLHVISGADPDAFAGLPLLEATFSGNDTVRVDDIARDPRGRGLPEGHLPVRSFLSTPVLSNDGRSLGALLFGHPEPGVFDERAEHLVRIVAANAAVAVENARLYSAEKEARELAERRTRSLEVLQEVTTVLADAWSGPQAEHNLSEVLTRGLGIDGLTTYLLEGERLEALDAAKAAHAGTSGLARDCLVVDALVCRRSGTELAQDQHALREHRPDIESAAALPLRVGGSPFGALVLTWARPHTFTESERRLLSAVGEQLASTLERLRLDAVATEARRQLHQHVVELTEASQTLQRSLLPRKLPSTPYVDVAARYRPGAANAEVGGDWYDMVVGPDDRVTLVIGDVEGHSFSAAAVMGRVSTALHAYLIEGHPPDVALTRVNPIVEEAGVLVTCCLVSFDPRTGVVLTARAGHPPPLYGAGPAVSQLSEADGGPPLGVSASDAVWTMSSSQAAEGDRLVLFTDGLVERHGADMDVQVRHVLDTMGTNAGATPAVLADAVLTAAGASHGDDIAILVADLHRAAGVGRPVEDHSA